jgi:hypothetical protein
MRKASATAQPYLSPSNSSDSLGSLANLSVVNPVSPLYTDTSGSNVTEELIPWRLDPEYYMYEGCYCLSVSRVCVCVWGWWWRWLTLLSCPLTSSARSPSQLSPAGLRHP